MALNPQQQAQYNQLVKAGASQQAAMQAALLVPSGTTQPGPTYSSSGGAIIPQAPPVPQAPQVQTGSTTPNASNVNPAMAGKPGYDQFGISTGTGGADIQQANVAQGVYQGQDGNFYYNRDGSFAYGPKQTSGTGMDTYQGLPTPLQPAPTQEQTGAQAQTQGPTPIEQWMSQMGYTSPYTQLGAAGQNIQTGQAGAGTSTAPTGTLGASGQPSAALIGQNYQNMFASASGTAPQSQAEAQAALGGVGMGTPTDPYFGAMTSSVGPIMGALLQVVKNINDPMLTGMSLQQEYNQIAQQNNLPGLQAQMLNMQNIMYGTQNDIIDEVNKAGGTITQSQLAAMTTARNNVILKQYNALSTQYQAAQTQVQNMMQYAATDQQTELQKQQITASITESIASVEQQMLSMGMTMQQNAATNLNKIVTNVGYNGLAAGAQDNPRLLGYYESVLGLPPGSLSDQNTLGQLETYRQQQLALGQQRVNVYSYINGVGTNGLPGTNTTSGPPVVPDPAGNSSGTTPYTESQLQRPSWLPSNIPMYMSAEQMQQAAKTLGYQQDSGTSNYVAPNIGYYVKQSDGSYVLNSSIPQQVAQTQADKSYSTLRSEVLKAQGSPVTSSPTVARRWSLAANSALKNYTDSAIYKQVSNGASYLGRISAALTQPGSVSDLELADSIIKIMNGGGQVTEAQLTTYFAGASFADKFNILNNKLNAKGGVLSTQQRKDLATLADETFKNFEQQYETLYVQAGSNLKGQGIPIQFLGNMPDFIGLLSAAPIPDFSQDINQ